MVRLYSANAVTLVKNAEGLRLSAYQDPGGIWTIGWGHTGKDVFEGLTITELQAEKLLDNDLQKAANIVNTLVLVDINQNQFDALVDFTLNLGGGNLQSSTLLRYLNQGNFDLASKEFPKWIYQGKVKLEGLEKRRQAELVLFNSAPSN